MKKNILVIFVCLFSVQCYKEKNPGLLENVFYNENTDNYSDYHYVPISSKTIVYKETFENGAGIWWIGNQNNLEASMLGGSYRVSNTDATLWRWLKQDIPIDTARNFELEAQIKVLYSQTNDGAGIALVSSLGDLMPLLLDADNRLSVFSYENAISKKNDHKNWMYCSCVSSTGHSLLTIRKAGGKYYFFVNEQSFGLNLPTNTITPDKIAIFLDGYTTVDIEEISFSYF